MNAAAAYIDRAKRRHWFTCPCGARRVGHQFTWPAWPFRVTVYRICSKPAAECREIHQWADRRGAVNQHPVQLGPYPAETPVCPHHTLEKVAS